MIFELFSYGTARNMYYINMCYALGVKLTLLQHETYYDAVYDMHNSHF